ncbi:uncharacterized protein LOC114132880 [Aphis gossypii]|uniref:uncharacterized protein LOC114132880 n=1 Tax=Aphis gossypii TaxID=80765 RepID=UPI002159615E|nr:uncharacterized protein LOC114132880 [Aphis gossypii]
MFNVINLCFVFKISILICFICGTVGRTFELITDEYGRNRDTATTTTLRPVTPPCFECTTQTAERPAKLCGDYVVTFKYACTDDPCHTTNPCCTHKFGCKKTKTNKSCYIEQMEAANRKSQASNIEEKLNY